MTMANFRLPSGVYMNMVAVAAADEANFVSEYPTFHSPRGIGRGRSPADGSWTPTTLRAHHKDEHLDHKAPFMRPSAVGRGLNQPESQAPQPAVCLPLVSVSIDMQVDCNIAKTKLVQTFTNHGGISIPEAWYSFPLYDGATVTAFRCEVGEDKVLEGKVKPKGEAKDEFKRAVQKQEAAALIEELTPDVFQTSIGNIKPSSTVRVEITYVEELHNDLGGDGIVVTIPTSVAPRYGMPPAGYTTNSAAKDTGISLVMSVVTPGPTKEIVCRSGHGISIEYGKINHTPEAASFEALAGLPNHEESELSPNHATIRLSHSQAVMDRDFILFIPSFVGGLLKSRAILAPSSGSDHAAMMVTVSPNELFSDLEESMDEFDGEILFLADRSGSMAGPKIEELRDALLVFLKSLPTNCKFNIYSFGSNVASLWPQSMPYNESSMQKALNHVSTFVADFGGTEVLNALTKAVGNRLSTESSSTQLILLTDGEIWQAEKTIDFVRTTTSEADGQVRFFGLGIGNRVSHQLIQGIGFFGGGFGEAVSVDAHGRWKEAVVNMLKGAVMPNSWSYSIQFGDEWNERRLDLDDLLPYQEEKSPPEALRRLAGATDRSFIRSPRTIPLLHHFGQQSVYFLLDSTNDHLPECVTIKACSQHGGTKTTTLAITKSTTNNIMQHLAAKAAVRDLETQDTAEVSSGRIRKNAEHLCQMYSITSKWASFVAVSHLQPSAEYEDVEVSLYKAPLAELDLMVHPSFSQAGANPPARRLASPTTTIDYTPPPVSHAVIINGLYERGANIPAPTRPRIEECLTSYDGRMSRQRDEDSSGASGTSSAPSPKVVRTWETARASPAASIIFGPERERYGIEHCPSSFSLEHVSPRENPLCSVRPPDFVPVAQEDHRDFKGERHDQSFRARNDEMRYRRRESRTTPAGKDEGYSFQASHASSTSHDIGPSLRPHTPTKLTFEQPVPRDEIEERSMRDGDRDDPDASRSALPYSSTPVRGLIQDEDTDDEPEEISSMGRRQRLGTVDTTASSREPSPPDSVKAFAFARRPPTLNFSEQGPENAELPREKSARSGRSRRGKSSASRPNDTTGLMAPKEQLEVMEESDKGENTAATVIIRKAEAVVIDVDDELMQTLNCPYPPRSDYNHVHQRGSGVREIDWLELIRCQHADGLFDLEESLEVRIAQHFCYGTRQALRDWIVHHRKRSLAYTNDKSVTTELFVDTVMALAYIRSHLYSQRALWELLVKKAERRLASHFHPEQWDRPDSVSEIVKSALVHAHYGDGSQEYEGDSNGQRSPSRGRCGVCNPQDGRPLLPAQHDDRRVKCYFPDCGVFLRGRDEFWIHAAEQNHILSSCENAANRYREAAAKALEAQASRERRPSKGSGLFNCIQGNKKDAHTA